MFRRQVLKGDVKSAIETHEMLYQVMQRHNFLPEAFTTDFQVRLGAGGRQGWNATQGWYRFWAVNIYRRTRISQFYRSISHVKAAIEYSAVHCIYVVCVNT